MQARSIVFETRWFNFFSNFFNSILIFSQKPDVWGNSMIIYFITCELKKIMSAAIKNRWTDAPCPHPSRCYVPVVNMFLKCFSVKKAKVNACTKFQPSETSSNRTCPRPRCSSAVCWRSLQTLVYTLQSGSLHRLPLEKACTCALETESAL